MEVDKMDLTDWTRVGKTQFLKPPTGKVTCKICFMGDYTGYVDIESGQNYPSDMDCNIHEGFTIGKGKRVYFMMIWHSSSGNVTVYDLNCTTKRWISGDSEITIHWK